ncbi:hypothetical protein A2U01_0109618, partial [Trifolium medium]|nr:hypothetical protein [Trifolium medium]
KKDLGDLKVGHAEERKSFEEELGKLKSVMAPADGEPESVRGLTACAELVERIQKLENDVFKAAQHRCCLLY